MIREKDQFAFWRDGVNSLVGLEREERYESPFSCQVDQYTTSRALISQLTQNDRCIADRSHQHIAQDGIDIISLQYRMRGKENRTSHDARGLLDAGDIVVTDLSQPFKTDNGAYSAIIVSLNKTELAQQVPFIEQLHGTTIKSGPIADLFRNFLIQAPASLTTANGAEAEKIGQLTATLAAEMLLTHRGELLESERISANTTLHAVKQCIKENLSNPQLSPELITHKVGISRAGLYRLCKPLGSPMGLVKQIRLNRAARLLRENTSINVANIAFMVGFTAPETFSRAFKELYGVSPRTFRHEKGGEIANKNQRHSHDWNGILQSVRTLSAGS